MSGMLRRSAWQKLRLRHVMASLTALVAALSICGFLELFPARFADFRAFYCAGGTVFTQYDPYREHPLHECEQALHSRLLSTLPADITIPAPFPAYALALFSLVARLPIEPAILVWTLCSGVALLLSIVLVSRLTSASFSATSIALGFPACIVPLPLGQPTLFTLLAIVTCATLLCAQRPRAAAGAALMTAIDPHIAIAVCLGLFIGVPQTRLTLTVGTLVLGALNTVISGVNRQWEYLHDVLPLHALVNVPEFSQFSTANLAFTAGLSAKHALVLGNVWYTCAIAVGIFTGLRLQSQLSRAAVALVPVSFVVFGGTHTHLQQLALAIPAFLLICAKTSGLRRTVYVGATFIASIPWLIAAPFPYLLLGTTVLALAFARSMNVAAVDARLGALAFVVFCTLCFAVARATGHAVALDSPVTGNPLAEVAWGRFVSRTFLPLQGWYLVAKLPTLIAFSLLLGALVDAAVYRESRFAQTSGGPAMGCGGSPA